MSEFRDRNKAAREAALMVALAALALIGLLLLARAVQAGVEPEIIGPGWVDTLTTPAVNFLGSHPIAFLVVGLAILVTNGLRVAWPVRTERPRPVAFLLGVLDPLAGNAWAVIRWAASKVGFPVQSPATSDPPSGGGRIEPPKAGDAP